MGYLFMAVGLSNYNVALFHLVNHAFFKALLFLAAGSVIHAMADQQDVRKLGGLIKFLPFTYTAILIGSLSLMALP
jgi:NADH-ubiquinone oxidoreductase chain 5